MRCADAANIAIWRLLARRARNDFPDISASAPAEISISFAANCNGPGAGQGLARHFE
jgi:hypothetical protein